VSGVTMAQPQRAVEAFGFAPDLPKIISISKLEPFPDEQLISKTMDPFHLHAKEQLPKFPNPVLPLSANQLDSRFATKILAFVPSDMPTLHDRVLGRLKKPPDILVNVVTFYCENFSDWCELIKTIGNPIYKSFEFMTVPMPTNYIAN
jgi:hypothetical protein